MSQQSIFITDGGASGNNASVTAQNTADGGFSLQSLVAQYNSAAPTLTSGNLTFLQTDAYGALKISGTITSTDQDAANPNTALPAQTSWIGASDGTNLQGLLVESSSALNLRTSLWYGATEMKIWTDGYTAVHQADSPWVVSGTVTANAGTGTFQVNVTNATIAVTQSTSPWVVSGTVAVTQSTSPWVITGQYAPNVAAGTDAEKALTAQFNATGAATAVSGPVDGYRFADVAVTNGNVTYAQTDGYGRLEMTGATAIAYAYENRINQTITLKNTAGVLRKVIVGNAGKTGALLTFYDNTAASGTVIAKINTSSILGQLVFDIPFAVGLTYTTNAPSPAADVTITFE